MSDLTRAEIEKVDPEGMLDDVLAQVLQLGDALWRVQSAELRKRDLPGGIAVCGMGGSAIGADLAAAVLGDRATRPLRTIRDYALEPWAGPDTLVLCCSYSGDTEETLACFEAAGIVQAPRIVVTTGGKLADAAREEGVPVIGVPAGMRPRAAVLYFTVAVLECAALCGAAPQLHTELDSATGLLERLAETWGPDAQDSEAKALARELQGTLPVVYGSGPTVSPARRWKTQLNENAEMAAFWSELPEADHNEICGWARGAAGGSAAAVFLADSDQHPRIRRRIELTCAEVARSGARALQVESQGETRLERILSLVLLGDLVSVYAAALGGVNPAEAEAIARLRSGLESDSDQP
ncbi:MAG TPA: bifunctional phosphoglucose/phosphomannose isomerase [Thermoleophilaceae bacterium]|nr:bifunctional phosphoglucose/phosphomannose isomerase [Thermoleophilaceae bacterium]